MNWIEVRVHTSQEAEEAVADFLLSEGAGGTATWDSAVLDTDWDTPFGEMFALAEEDYPDKGIWLAGYFSEAIYDEALLKRIEMKAQGLKEFGLDPGPVTIVTQTMSEESWANAWKVYYKPVRVTKRLTVKPVWEDYTSSPGEQIIELDPGMAFGTGTHPTTTLSMKLLENEVSTGTSVVDVGCGSGILAVAAAKLGATEVLALDLDPVAVEQAKANVALNHSENQVRVKQNDLLNGVERTVDVVVANILAEIILRFVPDLPRVLKQGGTFIASGIIQQKEEQVVQALVDAGYQVVERLQEGDWVAIAARS
ncbi:50S ribosomal protein L11 methyltransferase [Marininema halotolerans]|uniref:Ribosomal protein L11 methyltransferase n=1 Tax=Marininema halotolerans TaxID=1155944 RepID=A0A1I6T051_9BACL|nr:50S ribosomal protein L11 methyltransferase [Marininema halotolerans]SFS82397.1 ribosomal protein L11 methyltransferase [Marininema halotolerans]